MGADGSKSNDGNDQQRRDLRMRQNADLAKHVAQENVNERGANKQNVERVLLILIQSTEKQNVKKDEKKQVSIDGVNYTITQFLNKGGFGEVYKAHSHQHNKDVAIKIMMNTPEIREEIENEIKFLQLTKNIRIKNHPVIDYFGCEIRNEGIFIAMELAICDLLTFWFNQMSDKDPKDKFLFGFLIIAYVLRALIFLEKLNIIHGDIKPQNLVIVQGNQCFYVKLIDFGTVEKMSTNRHQLTVDFNKAHTLYFASPEFLKRDSNRMISRHLNKKSDAWAAGVMFYLLFFERLPWKDQYDYENFCNDPNARDIIVPELGGYKLIIELLLKKNPRDRSSAKDTLMQIKSHPVLGDLLSTIQQTFYPVDDVCHINVPIQLKQQLEKLARTGRFASASESSASGGSTRRSCWFGKDCYRHDPDHREEYAHPGDRDFHSSSNSTSSNKMSCRYGSHCFRTDREHRLKYLHPENVRSSSVQTRKDKCRYGDKCYKTTDKEHTNRFSHD